METLNSLQLREVFHIEFLRWLGRKVKAGHYAVKGGANLRFFFKSFRYSEDMDLDARVIRVVQLKEIVMKIKIILSVFILILLILWTLSGCKESGVEPEDSEESEYSGKIAFTSWQNGNPDIYIMNGNGSNQINLTQNEGRDENPVFSPDGSKMAFVSHRDGGNGEIYIMNTDGSNQINLTQNEGGDYYPVFSPDGSKIVFNRNMDIYIMNDDGSNQINLTNREGYADNDPVFSPDGSKIAFRSYRDTGNRNYDYEIYIMNTDGSNQINLSNREGYDDNGPVFSPDGSKIAFYSELDYLNSEIYIMNIDGSNQINLTNNESSNYDPIFQP